MLDPRVSAAVCSEAGALHARLAAAVSLPTSVPAIEWPGAPYNPAPSCIFHEDLSWFGLGGWLAVTLAVIVALAGMARRKLGLPWLLAAGTLSYLACASLLLRWQPWQGRLLITMAALSSPLLGLLAQEMASRRFWRIVLQLAVLYAVATGLSATIDSATKPLGLWNASAATMQVWTRPEMETVLQHVARTVPANARLGVFLNGDDWDFPLFGPRLDRTVVPLVLSPNKAPDAHAGSPAYVLTHQPANAVRRLFSQLRLTHCRLAWTAQPAAASLPWRLYDCRE